MFFEVLQKIKSKKKELFSKLFPFPDHKLVFFHPLSLAEGLQNRKDYISNDNFMLMYESQLRISLNLISQSQQKTPLKMA